MSATDTCSRRITIVGVGNLDRGDDAVGRIVARQIMARLPFAATVVENEGGAAEVLETITGIEAAIIVDAVYSNAAAGCIHRIDAATTSLPSDWFNPSTHGFGVAEAVELGRTLGTLPPFLIFYGVESTNFSHGAPPSDAVRSSIDTVITRILEDVANHLAIRHETD